MRSAEEAEALPTILGLVNKKEEKGSKDMTIDEPPLVGKEHLVHTNSQTEKSQKKQDTVLLEGVMPVHEYQQEHARGMVSDPNHMVSESNHQQQPKHTVNDQVITTPAGTTYHDHKETMMKRGHHGEHHGEHYDEYHVHEHVHKHYHHHD
jgi:hypothetical protein